MCKPKCPICLGYHDDITDRKLMLEDDDYNAGRIIFYQWHKAPRQFIAILRELDHADWPPLAEAFNSYCAPNTDDDDLKQTLSIWERLVPPEGSAPPTAAAKALKQAQATLSFTTLLSALTDCLESNAELLARNENDPYPADRYPNYAAEAVERAQQRFENTLNAYIDARIATQLKQSA